MKKKLKLLFTSHLHDRFGLIMRFCFLAGLLVTIQLSHQKVHMLPTVIQVPMMF